ncbi:MAG: NADH-quinone oxidoreductase subunit NuoG, partial [Acidimicrobiales bacterium]
MTGSEPVCFTVNGSEVQAEPGTLLIKACEDAGVYIPRFCYHERLDSVGMCRMCIVEVDTGRGPSLQPSCILTVSDSMVVETESATTQKAQEGILEFLLVNHPLDCPVCDKGGECPLQDHTMAYGPGESRFIEEKRHFEKPIPVNDNVFLDRERCILCDRCTRFADEVAGDPLIHFMDRGNQTQVNTFPGEPFSSYFSGNVVQICPVGALTAKPYRFKARPWDLEEGDSTYPNAMGDRINIQASRDQVLRFQGVDSDAVNWGWLADKDRFAFEPLQSDARLTTPLIRGGGLNEADPDGSELVATTWSHALGEVAKAIAEVDPSRVAVLGGARLTNEAQYAWTKLAKGIIGTDNVDVQLGDELPTHALLGLPRATIAEACEAGGTIILLGPDPKEDLGTLYIRLRHAVVKSGAKLIELTPSATGLSNVAAVRLHARPGEVGAVARALVSAEAAGDVGGVESDDLEQARELIAGNPVTVVLGRASMAESVDATIEAADALRGIDGVRFLPTVRRGNTMGGLDMGMSPGLLPGRASLESGRSSFADVWPNLPATSGLDAQAMLAAAAAGEIDVLVLLGADPINDAPKAELAARALDCVRTVVAVDLFATDSVVQAGVVLPAAAFTETSGSHTNIEGRVTAIRQRVTPPGTARADWSIAAELARLLDGDLGIDEPGDIWAELAPRSAVHADVSPATIEAAPDGVLTTAAGWVDFQPPSERVTVDPLDAYALRLVAVRRMYDRGTLLQHSTHLTGLAGYQFSALPLQLAGEAIF